MEAAEKFRVVKAENVKERTEILYKLAQSYINREASHDDHINDDRGKTVNPGETEVVEESLEGWSQNRMRGFKKTQRSESTSYPNSESKRNVGQSRHNSSNPVEPRQESSSDQNKTQSQGSSRTETPSKISYCHYFSNFGECEYERKTDRKCEYVHSRNVPVCIDGRSCTRSKCMFKHPNPAPKNQPFLEQQSQQLKPNMENQTIHPYQWIPPWLLNGMMNQYTVLNPWQTPHPTSQATPWQRSSTIKKRTRRGYGGKRGENGNFQVNLSLLGNNINGLNSKIDSLSSNLVFFSPSILTIQETKLRIKGSITLNGYKGCQVKFHSVHFRVTLLIIAML